MPGEVPEPHLILENVSKQYELSAGWPARPRTLTAVSDVSLSVARGETLGLVGESGCGKSTLARLMMHLETPSGGSIRIDGMEPATLNRADLIAARRNFQMVFQDPYASLNPHMSVRAIIAEALRNYGEGDAAAIQTRVEDLAAQVGLGAHFLDRHPHELSGGQCQRVGIARAIALNPSLIVADEPVSALDVSIQAQILNLLLRLQAEMGLTLVFVSHDLSVMAHLADRVAVMYLGRIVEIADAAALFEAPAHPYTAALLAALPRPTREGRGRRAAIGGELPSPIDPPSGCHFRTRCPRATDRCAAEAPPLRPIAPGRFSACHHAEAQLDASTPQPAGGSSRNAELPVILLPGLQSDHRSWTHQLDHFEGRRDVRVPSGHQFKPSIAEMARHVIAQLPERFHLVAWSMGGYIAFEMLPEIRERLASLVLVSTSAQPENEADTARRRELIARAEKDGMAVASAKSMAFSYYDIDALDPQVREAVLQSSVDLGVEAYRSQQEAIIARPDAQARLQLVDVPTLMLVGEHDQVTPPDRAREIAAAIPGTRLEILPGCAHCAPMEKPDEVNTLLDAWFREHEAGREDELPNRQSGTLGA